MTLGSQVTQENSSQVEDLEGQWDDANIRMTNMEVAANRLLKGVNDLHTKVMVQV